MRLFRVAVEATTARHVSVTFVQIVLFWSTFLALLPWCVVSLERALALPPLALDWHQPIGGIVFVAASSLGLASGITMAVFGRGTPLPLATARDFVQRGPYRFVRNPMALAGIVQGIGVGLWLDSVAVVLYALAGAAGWQLLVRPPEERDLEARFGAVFADYRDRVPLWLPRLPAIVERTLGLALVAFALALAVRSGARSWTDSWRLSPAFVLAVTLGLLLRLRAASPRASAVPARAP